MKKVLILGSGGLSIGQAGEFDYSGSQAIKALKEENLQTILVNPNIATIQTSSEFADKVYFLPVTYQFVKKIIEKEKPDGILLSFGGQTALNCGIELYKKGILRKFGVNVLGTPVETIIATEDRDLFVKKLKEINIKVPDSIAVTSIKEAINAVEKIGFPVIVRGAYSLGGLGSGFAENKEELKKLSKKALATSSQILIEKSLKGWKEVEYEVVRDCKDNCITVCNMENVDPLGIHTGESIVVAPSQTLTNDEYHKLRTISITVIRHLGIIGECNIQFALDPYSEDYCVIEVNARLSRSSALASKATGYPLAFVAAKLSLGKSLTEIKNAITKATCACFEPSLDYITLKFPKWDLEKFKAVSKVIGSSMKSVGEVMAIGRTFEEVLQKAIRMSKENFIGLVGNNISFQNLKEELRFPSDMRIFAVAKAIEKGMSLDKIARLTNIDKWFLHKIKNIVEVNKELAKYNIKTIPKELLKQAKMLGFSDAQIGKQIIKEKVSLDKKSLRVRRLRKSKKIFPFIKQIDTLAGEYPAKTNYLYLTYNGSEDDITIRNDESIVILGSGAYKIGNSVEFDWCCVNCTLTLSKLGYKTIMINYNPETVSTDYDICDRLYFEELTLERVLDIYEKENPQGVVVSMGGQIPNNLALRLHEQRVKILGTAPKSIDNAEDRHKFSKLLDELNVDQPPWKELTNMKTIKNVAEKFGYPILIRPSYILSGSAMSVASNEDELKRFLKKASLISKEHPVVITKFLTGAKEIEIDAVANKGDIICYAISEHVENAGVHSGDATLVTPPQRLYHETVRRIKKITRMIAKSLDITGPFNIQYLAKDNEIKVIECNLRASRSFPFVSKVYNVNFIDLATRAIMGRHVRKIQNTSFDLDYVGVKAPQFSFTRLRGADPILGVEMASTGEVACFGDDIFEAFLKAILSTGFKIPKKSILLSTGTLKEKGEFIESAKKLVSMGYKLFATSGTSKFLDNQKINNTLLHWPLEDKKPNALDYITNLKVDLVINIPKSNESEELSNDYIIRRTAVDFSIPIITNIKCANLFVKSISKKNAKDLQIKSWDEYL